MLCKILLFVISIQTLEILCKEVEVQTHIGKIRGIVQKSRKGCDYYSFRGVRYAEPPTGENRFRPPVPIKSWNGTLDATKDGFICPQKGISPISLISEDCLNLNVYSKNLNDQLPVLVFIHGGYFTVGGGHSEVFWGPQYLMDKDIVVVTINYRLGPLGFLNSGSEDAPGNFGLKDQVIALQWVQDNIQYFGGDPTKVTISGNSAGSASVSLHMVSPMSQGLFCAAIASSATAVSHYFSRNQILTKQLGSDLNCPINDSKAMVQCLRTFSWEKLVTGINNELIWMFDVEDDFGQEQFLSENPMVLYAQGKFAKIPVLVGITKDEYDPITFGQFGYSNRFNELNEDFYKAAPKILMYDPTLTTFTKSLRSVYLNDTKITAENLDSYAKLESDAIIHHGIYKFVQLARKHTDVFYYRFDYQGRFSSIYKPDGNLYGVSHTDDLFYIFVRTKNAPMFSEYDPENVMVEIFTTIWSTFVQTGNPNNKTNPWISNIKWEPSAEHEVKTLYIDKDSHLGNDPLQKRMEIWDIFFPVPNQH